MDIWAIWGDKGQQRLRDITPKMSIQMKKRVANQMDTERGTLKDTGHVGLSPAMESSI